jgi:hypothetical protein
MKKIFFWVMIISLLSLSLVSAVDLTIQPQSDDVAMVIGLQQPAVFDLKITNKGAGDNFMFYNFFGSDMFPKGTVLIGAGETKIVQVGIYPRDDLKQEGWVKFDIFIKGQNKDEMSYPLMVKVVKLKDAFEVGAEEFKPDSNNVTVYVKNLLNFNFDNVVMEFKSSFFNFEKSVSLGPHEKKSIEITLNREDFRDLMAGYYTLNVEVIANNQKANVEGTMKFSEKDIVTSTQNEYGVIINTKRISKINEGNVISTTQTVLKKNIISRLFTSFNPEPTTVEREGFFVYYTWQRELKPGEELQITVRTNWLLPFLAILLIIAAVILTKQFSRRDLSIKKRVTFVRAKGGEFALKVSIIVNARRFVERVNVIDRLPPITKLHERFGGQMPKKVDTKNRRIEWYFDRLQDGEMRVISYIIYSKVGVLGKFELPTATAIYERDGEVHETESNRAFFIADQARKPVED